MRRIYIFGDICENKGQLSDYKITNFSIFDSASKIVQDVAFSDIIIIDSTEFPDGVVGIGLGLLKDIYVIGGKENAMGLFKHPSIEYIGWDECVSKIRENDKTDISFSKENIHN